MKRVLVVIFLLTMVLSCITCPVVLADSGINVAVDGKNVTFPDAKPFVDINNRTLIPVRFVSEALGAIVGWNEKAQEVSIEKGTVKIIVKINDKNILVNGKKQTMDTQAIIKGNRTFVPIRYVAEALGATVTWDDKSKTVIIKTGNSSNVEVVEGITFNRVTDVVPSNGTVDDGAMKIDKVQEFVEKYFKSIKIYKENGKNYISGYLPNVPYGNKWTSAITFNYIDGKNNRFLDSNSGARKDILIYPGKSFKFELLYGKEQLKSFSISAWIYNSKGGQDGKFYLRYPDKQFLKYSGDKDIYLEFDWEDLFKW